MLAKANRLESVVDREINLDANCCVSIHCVSGRLARIIIPCMSGGPSLHPCAFGGPNCSPCASGDPVHALGQAMCRK